MHLASQDDASPVKDESMATKIMVKDRTIPANLTIPISLKNLNNPTQRSSAPAATIPALKEQLLAGHSLINHLREWDWGLHITAQDTV